VRTVLVVEPNEQVMEGYRRLLRTFSASWDVSFAPDTAAALERVTQKLASVVILDARTPGLDPFLVELRAKHPLVTRVVLAGAELKNELAVQLAMVAHQVVKKPFIPPQLFEVVERTCKVSEGLANERLRLVLGQLGALPVVPQTYQKLVEMTANPDVSLDAVSAVVERDPSITAAVLRIINSAYFGLPRRVSSVRETVRFLGIQPLKNIVLTVEIFEGIATGKAAQVMQQEALSRGCAMREVLGRTPLAESAFAAGILCDVGALLLATRLPIDAMAIAKQVDAGRLPVDVERERLGCTHADLGAAILAKWNLPNTMVEAVALHHSPPENAPAPTLSTALALVTAVEYSHRTRDELKQSLRATAERLIAAFPTVTIEQLDRYFGRADEKSA
jgi:HD-like signal output (HDOD) protein